MEPDDPRDVNLTMAVLCSQIQTFAAFPDQPIPQGSNIYAMSTNDLAIIMTIDIV